MWQNLEILAGPRRFFGRPEASWSGFGALRLWYLVWITKCAKNMRVFCSGCGLCRSVLCCTLKTCQKHYGHPRGFWMQKTCMFFAAGLDRRDTERRRVMCRTLGQFHKNTIPKGLGTYVGGSDMQFWKSGVIINWFYCLTWASLCDALMCQNLWHTKGLAFVIH